MAKSKKKASKKVSKKKASKKVIAQPDIPKALLKRAKKLGMAKEVIATYTDPVKLKLFMDGISQKTNPDAQAKRGVIPAPVKHEDKMPDKVEFDSKIEIKFTMQNRAQFDENRLQEELRAINRQYGSQKPKKIIKTTMFEPVKGLTKFKLACKHYVTHYEIIF